MLLHCVVALDGSLLAPCLQRLVSIKDWDSFVAHVSVLNGYTHKDVFCLPVLYFLRPSGLMSIIDWQVIWLCLPIIAYLLSWSHMFLTSWKCRKTQQTYERTFSVLEPFGNFTFVFMTIFWWSSPPSSFLLWWNICLKILSFQICSVLVVFCLTNNAGNSTFHPSENSVFLLSNSPFLVFLTTKSAWPSEAFAYFRNHKNRNH